MVAISLMPNYFGVTLCDIFQQFNGREISGCRGRQPLHQSSTATKSLSLFADFTLYKRTQKAVQSFHSDTALLISLLYFSL